MNRLMTHVVVGYPDLETSRQVLQAMVDQEVAAIELQIPFSDPIADGPVLMHANDRAVAQGTSVQETLRLLKSIKPNKTKLYIMTYLQPILRYDPKRFFDQALKAGCSGFIIPDLPFDAPETEQYIVQQPKVCQALVPVLSPGMRPERIRALFQTLQPETVYLTARHGITGDQTNFTSDLEAAAKTIRRYSGAKLAIGFGVRTPTDVKAILRIADLAVVGSALTKALDQSPAGAFDLLRNLSSAAR